jgi:hypothetical protein
MATRRQKKAARDTISRARQVLGARAHDEDAPRRGEGLSTAEENNLPDNVFAFPSQRKQPLTDSRHVRTAIARFDQVEGVSDRERDRAWNRVLDAAQRYGIDVSADSWRNLPNGGKDPD